MRIAMPIKITRNHKKLIGLTNVELIKPKFYKLLNGFIKDEVISSIQSGRSPVNKGGSSPKNTGGGLRYEKYSDSYRSAIKRGSIKGKSQTPRNLTVTGKMLRSIKSRMTKNYVRVWFTSPIAKYHDKLGAGKSKVIRRMIPDPKKGEKFNAGIRKRIANALRGAIKLALR